MSEERKNILSVNGKEVEFQQGMTVLQACELAGEEIPRFCYHERLKISGNCRMCLVQIEGGPPKPAASCAMPAGAGMKVHTNTPMVKKAREGVLEFTLMHHPLDCPICDQAGECDLQDQTMAYGRGESRYKEPKRAVKRKNFGPLISSYMTRCIHCTRCIRFLNDVAGCHDMGATGRGENMEVGTFIENNIKTEMSGNIVDLCPVGALTNRPYSFKARSWELTKTESIDVMDAVGSNIRIDSRGNEVMRILPRLNEDINEEWISDRTRYIADGLSNQRLDSAYIRNKGVLEKASYQAALALVVDKISNGVSFLSGSVSDCETIVMAKNIVDKVGGTTECRLDGQKYNASNRASYLFNSTIAGLEEADKILLIGTNPRYDATIINSRILKAVNNNGTQVGVIGGAGKYIYPTNNLGDVVDFAWLSDTKNAAIIIGDDVYKRDDINAILSEAAKHGTVNALPKTAGLVNGLELDFVSDKNLGDVVYLLAADEFDAEQLKDKFVIYQGSHGDAGANIADIILPSSTYSEKNATYVNLEGRVQKTQRAVFAPDNAKDDVAILADIAQHIGASTEINLSSIGGSASEYNFAAGNIASEPVLTKPYDYYLVNAICRASVVMGDCSKELSNISTDKPEADEVAA